MAEYSKLSGLGYPNKYGCLELISRYGPYQLGGGDGCSCSHFEVCGFHIDVSCPKSEHCVRVYSHHGYRQPDDEIEIASLVVKQLGDSGKNYRVRYCEYRHDHEKRLRRNGVFTGGYSCCYCGKLRKDKDGYLCADCLKNKDAVSRYPFGLDHLLRKCPVCGSSMVWLDVFGLSEMNTEALLVGGHVVGTSVVGTLPKQKGESIFRCLLCLHHWREPRNSRIG